MIAVLILIPVISFALFVRACYKTDWKAIDEQNRQFYADGYHIYYDRKILRQKEVEQLKSKLE
ncbi:hypothetical protein [Bacteroides intestinalis]|uniref:hypothetical protein n=1 Tax=Bacteroides intestinalis TaxID=329854 RepID=UPI0022E786AC|nr:hypothetical protein [Bacteroides intestinalis]